MLDNQKLVAAADRLAAVLIDYAALGADERNTGRAKTDSNQQIEKAFVSNRKAFIDQLTELLIKSSKAAQFVPAFQEAVNQAMMMAVDNFPLFIVLTRFRYVARKNGADAILLNETSPS